MINLSSSRYPLRNLCVIGLFIMGLAACQQNEEKSIQYPDASDIADTITIKRAKSGDTRAQTHLGWMYGTGNGVVKNIQKAITWYTIASNNGDKIAQFNLGIIYGNGQGVAKDLNKAVYWYRKSAEQGLRDAQYTMGGFYDKGYGVPVDHKEAVRWYMLAANQNLPIAQNALGVSYYKGEGISQDYVKAVYWYRKAAEQGFVTAMESLSDMCQHGKGTQRDLVCAYRWLALELSIVGANPDTPNIDNDEVAKDKHKYEALAKQLTSAQLQEADDWIKEWFAAHSK